MVVATKQIIAAAAAFIALTITAYAVGIQGTRTIHGSYATTNQTVGLNLTNKSLHYGTLPRDSLAQRTLSNDDGHQLHLFTTTTALQTPANPTTSRRIPLTLKANKTNESFTVKAVHTRYHLPFLDRLIHGYHEVPTLERPSKVNVKVRATNTT